jgi:hypothetical protein
LVVDRPGLLLLEWPDYLERVGISELDIRSGTRQESVAGAERLLLRG